MKKICILTSVHIPFDVRIFFKEAKSLANAGYDVTLIAQHDNDEVVDGIKIISLRLPRNRIERMTKTAWSVFWKALKVDADIYNGAVYISDTTDGIAYHKNCYFGSGTFTQMANAGTNERTGWPASKLAETRVSISL